MLLLLIRLKISQGEEEGDGYDLELVPNKESEENKTGITIKGKEDDYMEAHRILKDFFRARGQKYHINGIDIRVVDLPKNKLIKVDVKPKVGLSGKVNLNIYEVNVKGGATMMIQKVSGGGFSHVKLFGIKVIKFLLDGLISGRIEEEQMEMYKIKSEQKLNTKSEIKCETCGKILSTEQGLKIHRKRTHREERKTCCEMCDKTFSSEEGLKEHIKDMHGEILSPVAKKPKQSKSEMDTTEFSEDCEEVLKDLEMNSWEEIRLSHRGVEIKVNEEKVDKMEEYDEQERKNKVEEELENKKHDEMEKLNDEKVIRKQRDWFEEEVRYQEMKKKYSEEK